MCLISWNCMWRCKEERKNRAEKGHMIDGSKGNGEGMIANCRQYVGWFTIKRLNDWYGRVAIHVKMLWRSSVKLIRSIDKFIAGCSNQSIDKISIDREKYIFCTKIVGQSAE